MNNPIRKRVRSIPITQRNNKTEIYLLRKEKERIQKEKKRLALRQMELNRRMEDIQQELTILIQDWQQEMQEVATENQIEGTNLSDTKFKAKPLQY